MDIGKVIDSIAANTENPVVQNDYIGADGLIYCSECNTRKQTRVELFGVEKIVPCICKCKAEKLKREKEAQEMADFERRVKRLRETGFPDSNTRKWTFANDDGSNPKLTNVLHNYIENFSTLREKGKGLLLYGNVGTGKTFAAACVINALIDRGMPCYMTNFTRIANTLMGMFEGKQEYIDGLKKFRLVCIDDLAAERKTEYMAEIVYNVIDALYTAGVPMIITTNLTIDELKNPLNVADARCYDRILEKCFPVEVAGASHRRKNIIDDYDETKRLLGL